MPARLLLPLLVLMMASISLSACSDDDYGTDAPYQDMSVQVVADMTVVDLTH